MNTINPRPPIPFPAPPAQIPHDIYSKKGSFGALITPLAFKYKKKQNFEEKDLNDEPEHEDTDVENGGPLRQLYISFTILTLRNVDDVQQTFEVIIQLQQEWLMTPQDRHDFFAGKNADKNYKPEWSPPLIRLPNLIRFTLVIAAFDGYGPLLGKQVDFIYYQRS